MTATLRQEQTDAPLPKPCNGEPALTEEADLLDWDVNLAAPPRRPQGLIQIQLIYEGRSRPAPLADPAAD